CLIKTGVLPRRRLRGVGPHPRHRPPARRLNIFSAAPPQRITHITFRKLLALPVLGRTGGDGYWTVDRLNHVGHRNLGRPPRQIIPASGSLVRGEQPSTDEAL